MRFRKALPWLTAVLICLACGQTHAESLFENSNLASFGVFPDFVANGVEPYDDRLWDTDKRINGNLCCERKLYRVDGKKVVVLSHQGANFLVILISDSGSRMFFAASRGVYVEQPVQNSTTWVMPDWLE